MRFLTGSMRGRAARSAAVLAGLAIGAFALCVSVVGGMSVGRSVRGHLSDLFPVERVVLRPRAVDALALRFETTTITPATLDRVRSLQYLDREPP